MVDNLQIKGPAKFPSQCGQPKKCWFVTIFLFLDMDNLIGWGSTQIQGCHIIL